MKLNEKLQEYYEVYQRSFVNLDSDWWIQNFVIYRGNKSSSICNNFRASFAHKTNHSFMPNAEFVSFEHPRFGLVPCILATHDIMEGEEIFVHYGYDLTGKKLFWICCGFGGSILGLG